MVSESTKLGQMGRRGFIASLASLGVSGQAAATLTSEELKELTENPKRDVPQIKYYKHINHEKVVNGEEPPEREPVYYTIPRDRWVRINTTVNAVKQIGNKYFASGGSTGTVFPSENIQIGITNRVSDRSLGVVVQKVEYVDRNGNKLTGQDGTGPIQPDFQKLKETIPTTTSGTVSYDGKTETRRSIPVKVQKSVRKEQGGCQG